MQEVAKLEHEQASMLEFKKGYPLTTMVTSELIAHVLALLRLFAPDDPLLVPLRPTDAYKLRYIGGDASAEGFYIITQYPHLKVDIQEDLWEEKC